MSSFRSLLLFCAMRGLCQTQASGPMTDQRVVDLVSLGVSHAEILRMISAAPSVSFDLTPPAMDGLLHAGVGEELIKAMAAREAGQSLRALTASRPASPNESQIGSAAISTVETTARATQVAEVGAYYQVGGEWTELMPEVVNWKTGGVLKSVSTVGVVKGDVNGRLQNGRSRTLLPRPMRLLVYAPEGTQITEYQLIRLHTHSNSREFRTVTGGIFHVSGGSGRDNVAFESQHVAVRTWTVALDALQTGEYGLLPPGTATTVSASAQLGKMYTFTVQ